MERYIAEIGKYYSILDFQTNVPGAGSCSCGVSNTRCEMKKDTSYKKSIEFTMDEIRWIDQHFGLWMCGQINKKDCLHEELADQEYADRVGQKALKRIKRALYPMFVPPVDGK